MSRSLRRPLRSGRRFWFCSFFLSLSSFWWARRLVLSSFFAAQERNEISLSVVFVTNNIPAFECFGYSVDLGLYLLLRPFLPGIVVRIMTSLLGLNKCIRDSTKMSGDFALR